MTTPADAYAAFRERQADPEFASFRELYEFEFDPFQIAACGALSAGKGVLVAAPTGSGKTVVGEFAVHLALAQGRKCFYTTPIKALSNQKYADLVRRYGAARVGLLTGDNSINGEAPVVVMTTEVLRNMLYTSSMTLGGLSYVVLDEVHYLADRARGAVWEEVIIHLPESVRVVALSATVSNAEEFGDWLRQVRGGTEVIVDEHRPVPLWQHVLVANRLYDLFTDDAVRMAGSADGGTRVNPELLRIASREDWAARKARPRPKANSTQQRPGRGTRRPRRFPLAYRPDVIERLDSAGLLPAITFIFSRAGCDAAVEQCLAAGLRLTTPEEAEIVIDTAERRTADIPAEDLDVLGYGEWLDGLRRGIAAHHAGMLPAFKEVVEELFTRGLIRAVFATETLALGINMPARTVVIEKLEKWNGETHATLTAGEYTQLTGRAGRRGIDVEGHAVVLWQAGMDPGALAGLAGTRTYPLNSSFRPSYNMAVNLTGWAGRARASALLESSFAQFQADRGVVGLTRQIRKNRQALSELATTMACDRGDFAEYAGIRRSIAALESDLSRTRASARRAEAARSLALLRPGDIIRVPGGRRAGVAVVLQPGLQEFRRHGSRHSAGGGNGGSGPRSRPGSRPAPVGGPEQLGPGPLVLTAAHQVKRLSPADFPVPAEVIDRIRIPGSFSPRSPQHRRNLASTVRNRLAGRDIGKPSRAADWEQHGSDDAEAGGQFSAGAEGPGQFNAAAEGPGQFNAARELAELRRRLRRHPCHDCPDREQHARYAERYLRLTRETEALERRVAGRSHVIARTFDRVCAVLEHLGYLSGDTVTTDGKRLGGLYTELDLLAAECLRRGLWNGLNPAELAACVSTLTFESRQADDNQPPRLPRGRVPDVLTAMVRTWGELDQLEKDNNLSFLREPHLGFAWAAYRWARGARLEAVLTETPDLTPGDFVRAVKQLIDLLDQIATAAGDDLTAKARDAMDALRRGVVAYSGVTD
jgi:ATP-dependent RNA helicase HelY